MVNYCDLKEAMTEKTGGDGGRGTAGGGGEFINTRCVDSSLKPDYI